AGAVGGAPRPDGAPGERGKAPRPGGEGTARAVARDLSGVVPPGGRARAARRCPHDARLPRAGAGRLPARSRVRRGRRGRTIVSQHQHTRGPGGAPMRVVSVAAPGNGSGKTLTLSAILGAFPGRLRAVKFTTVFKDGVNCPRTEKACA